MKKLIVLALCIISYSEVFASIEIEIGNEWKFYWKCFYVTEQCFKEEKKEFSSWDSFGHDLFGWGSYRQVFSGKKGRVGLKIPYQASSYELYLNGVLISKNGVIGKTKSNSIPEFKTQYVIAQFEQHNELVFHVSNFHHHRGGALRPIQLFSSIDNFEFSMHFHIFINSLIAGILCFLFIHNASLFAFRAKEVSPLFLGLFCLSMALGLFFGSRELYSFIKIIELPWEYQHRIVYSLIPLQSLFFLLYFFCFYKKYFNKIIVYIFVLILMINIFFILVIGVSAFSITRGVMSISSVLPIPYILVALLIVFLKKEKYSSLIIIGFVLFLLSITSDFIQTFVKSNFPYITPIGLCVFSIFLTIITSLKNSKTHKIAEIQSIELERLIAAKDEILANTTHELKTPLNGILGITDNLISITHGKIKKDLSIISISGRRLYNLVNDILEETAYQWISNQ